MTGYEFIRESETGLCPNCGELFPRNPRGRPRRFCSEKCKREYHHLHPNKQNWTCIRSAVCPVCGTTFQAEREYGRLRKYCSHACANRGRAMEKKKQLLTEQERRGNDDREDE